MNNHEIKTMEDARASNDGAKVEFTIVTADDEKHVFACRSDQIENHVSWLIGLGQLASEQMPKQPQKRPPRISTRTVPPIEAMQLGIARGRTPEECALEIDLGSFRLVFLFQAKALYTLKDVIERMTPTVSPLRH